MAKKLAGPQMVIANLLTDGRVVFLTADGGWSKRYEEAVVSSNDKPIEALLAEAEKSEQKNEVVSIVAAEAVVSADGTTVPDHMKPLMQTKGPSVRPDLGYQAGQELGD